MRRSRSAFTLIELLVVVGIIGVLIGILLPSLGRARFQAKLTNCASNQRQYVLAMTAYAMKNDGVLPSFDGATGAGNLHDLRHEWFDVFRNDFAFNDLQFICPFHEEHLSDVSAATVAANGWGVSGFEIWIPRKQAGGSQNTQVPPNPNYGTTYQLVNSDIIEGPARIGDLIGQQNPVISDDILLFPAAVSNPSTFEVWKAPATSYYQDRIGHVQYGMLATTNIGFIDGHVEAVQAKNVKLRYKSGNAWNCR